MDLKDRDHIPSDIRDGSASDPESGNTEASGDMDKNAENSANTDNSPESWYENGRLYHRGDYHEPNGNGYQNGSGQYNGFGGGIYGNNYQQAPPNGMATAAMILGIISLVTSCCFYLAIPLGVIGVILAVLSQGSDRTLPPRAKSGLWLAVAGAALSLFLTVASVASTFSRYGVDGFIDMLRQYEQFYEGQSGQDGEISNYNDMKDWLEDYLNGKDNSRSRKIRQQEQDNII
ncbi:DUF4190 domain-containing protein [Murimonas intestini]|uniref:DUF4190 domain-containing protein n=1 Tax=Murimonas intestini TaxID=1337051 RepID=A0AB73SXF9_9FIRM|nr:DUF4190 domain-containing protein [Murimonas intestini]MCR1843442.1 hypothetical protein [Murimonas intestini]MCR1868775.1 hypothetical protein [Murimonas intestini]MCR1886370.1 hypothetical protein [Murimonas intestini]